MKQSFFKYLEDLESTGSSLSKEDILIDFIKNEPEAEEFLRLTFNDDVYGLAEKTFYNAFSSLYETKGYQHVSDFLAEIIPGDKLYEPSINELKLEISQVLKLSGNDLVMFIKQEYSSMDSIHRKWFSRCLLKDLRCGVQRKTVNKAFKHLGLKTIDKFALQLCETIDVYNDAEIKKYITFPVAMECKYDGIRLQAEVIQNEDGSKECKLTSRRGKDRTDAYPEICQLLIERMPPGIILDGEIISRSFQSLTRKDDKSEKKYVVFDILNDEKMDYMSRYDNLRNLFSSLGIVIIGFRSEEDTRFTYEYPTNIILAEHYAADNIDDVRTYFEQLNERGEEGIILKTYNAPYERGSRKYMFKCKKVLTADLLCYDYKLGEGKRAGMVSTLCLADSSGKIKVDVGSGIDDMTSLNLTGMRDNGDLSFIGKIVEIKYNEITETGSIRFPRFICFRDDKDTPDDLSQSSIRQGEKDD